MPCKLNNGGHFQDYDPLTGEYTYGSENDDRERLKSEPQVIEAKNNLLKARRGYNVKLPYPREYEYDRDYAQNYIDFFIDNHPEYNINQNSIKFIAFDYNKVYFSALKNGRRDVYFLSENGYLDKVDLFKGEMSKNVILMSQNFLISQTEKYISEMKKQKLNFIEENDIFATKDRNGNIIWLETGNDSAGLKHIIYGSKVKKTRGHKDDFMTLHGVTVDQIANDIFDMVNGGQILYEAYVVKNGKDGIERIYYKDSRYYLLCGVGTNGFIVSAYPIDEERCEEKIRR